MEDDLKLIQECGFNSFEEVVKKVSSFVDVMRVGRQRAEKYLDRFNVEAKKYLKDGQKDKAKRELVKKKNHAERVAKIDTQLNIILEKLKEVKNSTQMLQVLKATKYCNNLLLSELGQKDLLKETNEENESQDLIDNDKEITKYLEMLANHKTKKAKPAQPPVEQKLEQSPEEDTKIPQPENNNAFPQANTNIPNNNVQKDVGGQNTNVNNNIMNQGNNFNNQNQVNNPFLNNMNNNTNNNYNNMPNNNINNNNDMNNNNPTESNESGEEILPDVFDKNIHDVLLIIKQIMNKENKNLKEIFIDSLVKISKPNAEVITLDSFVDELNKRKIKLNYLQMNCFNYRYCINEELHALEIDKIEQDLNNLKEDEIFQYHESVKM